MLGYLLVHVKVLYDFFRYLLLCFSVKKEDSSAKMKLILISPVDRVR